MSWLNKIFKKPDNTAQVAKDRLSIIVQRERRSLGLNSPGYLPTLQQELLQVIAKYERVDLDLVHVNLERRGGSEVLELSVMLPEQANQEIATRPAVRNPLFA